MPATVYRAVLAELDRDISKAEPKDVVQYCADWFQDKLRNERSTGTSSSKQPTTSSPHNTQPTTPTSSRKLPNFPTLAFANPAGFSMGGAHPSPHSEQGSTGSPFGPPSSSGFGGVNAASTLSQRRATFASGFGSGTAPLGGAGAGGGGAPTSGLAHLAEEDSADEDEDEDEDEGPTGPASNVPRHSIPAIAFASFSFNGNGRQNQHQTGTILEESSPAHEIDSPFRSGGGGPPPAASSGLAHSSADQLIPPSYALGRRTSVSAESLIPTSQAYAAKVASGTTDADATPTNNGEGGEGGYSEPKTPSQLARIKQSIANNFLFRNLDDEQERDVLDAMRELAVPEGEVVIEQGATGDFFYVVESGEFGIYVKKGELGDRYEEGQDELENKWGKKVHTAKPGGSFGELALMYNAPRSATVIAIGPATLWALDRISFRTILLDHTSRKRRMYENFLATVPILSSLEAHERAKIADALESRTYVPGEEVVTQGQAGEEFYLIESGVAIVEKQGLGAIGELSKGDYFGELALLHREPRAATVRAGGSDGAKLKVAALGEKAFTRLLGPVREIMARTVGERYGIVRGGYSG